MHVPGSCRRIAVTAGVLLALGAASHVAGRIFAAELVWHPDGLILLAGGVLLLFGVVAAWINPAGMASKRTATGRLDAMYWLVLIGTSAAAMALPGLKDLAQLPARGEPGYVSSVFALAGGLLMVLGTATAVTMAARSPAPAAGDAAPGSAESPTDGQKGEDPEADDTSADGEEAVATE